LNNRPKTRNGDQDTGNKERGKERKEKLGIRTKLGFK